jgi:hypothetical protein
MILKNCPIKWAKLHQVDRTFTPAWSINAYLTPEQIEAVKAAAAEVSDGKLTVSLKHDDDGTYISCSRKEKRRDGTDNKPPRLVDANKRPFTEEVGNGSICNIIAKPFKYDTAGKKGVTMILEAVQVVDWHEYKGNEDFDSADSELGEAPPDEEDFPA